MRKNRTRKFNGGFNPSLVLFPFAAAINSKSFISNRISRQIQQPSNYFLSTEAGGGGGFIPPGKYSSITSFQEDPRRPKDENEHKEITETELLEKVGVRKTTLERLLHLFTF